MLASLRQSPLQPTPPEQEAIRAVWHAVDVTRMHLNSLAGRPEVAPNPELVELWSDASLKIAAFDADLAVRLRGKAEYWSDPRTWDPSRIKETRIGIDGIASDARALLQLVVPKPPQTAQAGHGGANDLFLSHASEDKNIVEPLVAALENLGVSVWYDNHDLQLGDDLRREIDKALSQCRFGAFLLSESFFAKNWPQLELDGLLALENADGRKRILPILHGLTQADLARRSPLLANRISISTDAGIPAVAQRIFSAIHQG